MWKGIAITGIWIGVGLVGLNNGEAGAFVSFFAMWATVVVACIK